MTNIYKLHCKTRNKITKMLTRSLSVFFFQGSFKDVSSSNFQLSESMTKDPWTKIGPEPDHWVKYISNRNKNLEAQIRLRPIKLWNSWTDSHRPVPEACGPLIPASCELSWSTLKCFSERVSGGLINWKCEGVIKKSLSRPRSFSVISLELFSNRSFTFSLLQIISN